LESLNLIFDPTPRPVSAYAPLWGRDPKTLNAWCAKGWVPGAYKHNSGEWWVRPLELLGFDPAQVQTQESERSKRTGPMPKHPERLRYPGAE